MNNMDLGNLNFGRLNLDSTTLQDDLQSTLSPHSSQMTDASQQSIAGLMLPPSASSLPGGAVGGNDLFRIRGDSGSGTVRPTRMLEDDLFIVGDDGTMNFDDVPIRQSQTHSSVAKDKPFSERRDRLSESVGVNMVFRIDPLAPSQSLTWSSLIMHLMMAFCPSRTTSSQPDQRASSSTRRVLRLQLLHYAARESKKYTSCP